MRIISDRSSSDNDETEILPAASDFKAGPNSFGKVRRPFPNEFDPPSVLWLHGIRRCGVIARPPGLLECNG
jgi:hypothetical protein